MLWQSPHLEPAYSHRIMRDFYAGSGVWSEMKLFRDETQSATSLLEADVIKTLAAARFYFGFALMAYSITRDILKMLK